MFGVVNNSAVTVQAAPNGAGGDSPWSGKTAEEIVKDINSLITNVYTGSKAIEMANTVLVPIEQFSVLSSKMIPNTVVSVLEYVRANNTYTATTGSPLMVRGLLELDGAGASSADRAIAYSRDPSVLRLHLPMPHRFLPANNINGLKFSVPGIFRTAGLEVLYPKAMRYMDGI